MGLGSIAIEPMPALRPDISGAGVLARLPAFSQHNLSHEKRLPACTGKAGETPAPLSIEASEPRPAGRHGARSAFGLNPVST
jgi:hypothetical protein